MAGVGVEQGVALSALFYRHRGTVEGKAFHTPDDVVVSHGRTMTERYAGVLDLDRSGWARESTCRGSGRCHVNG